MTRRIRREDGLGDWACEGQLDLTDLVGDEHIDGTIPSSHSERWTTMGAILDIVKDCENYLGWLPDQANPWRARAIAAVRLERAAASAQPPATTEDLRLALAWCQRHRQAIQHPSALVGFVKDARAHAVIAEPADPVGDQVRNAIAWERNNQHPQADDWIARLTRAHGEGRQAALAEWVDAGRG